MPLTAPPDYSRTFISLAIGLSVCIGLYTLTRHTTPIAGDNIHRLPFGGCYKDGTKAILYNRPGVRGPAFISFGRFEAALVTIIILGILILTNSRRSVSCHVCGRAH